MCIVLFVLLALMPKTLIPAAASAIQINPRLIAFKPRQVLLASYSKYKMSNAEKSPTLNEEDKSLLRRSIAQYLQKNGLSKTLKKFRSEAQIEEDRSKGLTLDLEEMLFKYLEKVNPLVTKGSEIKLEEVKETLSNIESEDVVDNKKRKKDKKKERSLTTDKENSPSEPLPQAEKKSKDTQKKKKSKSSADASVSEDDTKADEKDQPSQPLPQLQTKTKDKKKKKSKSSAEASVNEDETMPTEFAKENGATKKRKRDESPEEDAHTGKKALDESKRRKQGDDSKEEKSSKASKSDEKQVYEFVGKKDVNDLGEDEKTPSKLLSSNEIGITEKSGGKFSESKSSKKQRNGSAEPQSTTAKAFQRIKVEEVEFAHDKLKDNSYWAKDGADTGYGAKAQEVLGQVRGRDFRHEKTKKKRGSYRGGQIDLDSHSFKFNYSDEE